MNKIKDKTLLVLSSLGLLAFTRMNLVEHKPNRISQGVRYSGPEFFGKLGIGLIALWLILMALAFYKRDHQSMIVFILACVLALSILWLLPLKTSLYTGSLGSPRISLSAGFYLQLFCLYILLSTYGQEIKAHRWIKWLGVVSLFASLAYLILSGAFDDLSLIKEYQIKKTQFSQNLRIHGLLTLGSVATGAMMAIPLGFLAYSNKVLEDKIMVPLSIIETIPSLSLFGLLLVPLSGLGKLPFWKAIGVSGIGWAPAYIALTLYTLLPIGRNTLTGFYSVDKNIIEAAKGMGMSRGQVLRKIELPLAFPVIFTGIRIAFVQTIGGAVLAGLVGGGGMGTFVFLGLGEASPDLILLGVLPIVFFTVLLDYMLRALEKAIRGVIYD